MSTRPDWQLRSFRRVQLRILCLLVVACVVNIAVAWLPYFLNSKAISGGLMTLPILLVFDFRS